MCSSDLRGAYEKILEIEALHEHAFRALEALHQAQERWDDLAALYIGRHDTLAEAGEMKQAVPYMRAAATLYDDKLGDREQAFAAAQIAFEEDVTDRETLVVLERLAGASQDRRAGLARLLEPAYEATGAWRKLEDSLRARLASTADADERLAARRQQMDLNAKLYEGEVPAIREARRILAPAEEARVLAGLANQQFAWWRICFEGKTRVTRRPGLLARMIQALEEIKAEMQRVRDIGVRTEAHADVIQKVAGRITHFSGELEKKWVMRQIGRAHV